jgi:hypothetical protein
MSPLEPTSEVHLTIDHLVVRGLSAAESRELVGELRVALTAALSGQARTAPTVGRSQGQRLGRVTAARIARAAGRA